MKKTICLLIAILLIFPLIAEARRRPDSLNTTTAGSSTAKIVRGDVRIWSVTLSSTANTAYLTLYDEYEAPLDEANVKVEIRESVNGNSQTLFFDPPLDCSTGLYVWIGNGEYVIVYE